MRRILLTAGIVVLAYSGVCALFYYNQEHLLFHPVKHPDDYRAAFSTPYQELDFEMKDGTKLKGLLVKSDSSRGLVFYLHGNAGSAYQRIQQAVPFLDLGFDFFIMDYRGFGKSEGSIRNEEQLYNDVRRVYKQISKRYPDNTKIVYGYSLGTGLATKLAAENTVSRVILLAPYYSMVNLKNEHYPFLPTFLMKYRLDSFRDYRQITAPVTILHGKNDDLIDPENSILLNTLKPADTLILIDGLGHHGITTHDTFIKYLRTTDL